MREVAALSKQRQNHQRDLEVMLAAIRADIHNTAGKTLNRTFTIEDFMGSYIAGVEERARELIKQGYAPAEAAAIASSKRRGTRDDNLFVIDRALTKAARANKRKSGWRIA